MNELHRHYQETGGFNGFPIPKPTGPREETEPPQQESELAVRKEVVIEGSNRPSAPAGLTLTEMPEEFHDSLVEQENLTTVAEDTEELKEQAKVRAAQRAITLKTQERSLARLRRKRQWILAIILCITTTAATVLSPIAPFVAANLALWLLLFQAPTPVATKPLEPQEVPTSPTTEEVIASREFRLYRQQELIRVVASLKADGSILITGEGGSGKTVLKKAVVQQLTDDGFTVGVIELASTKQMLLHLCERLRIDTYSLEGKNLTIDGLKNAIAKFFQRETAFLIVDDAHGLPNQFRVWLKALKYQGVPMLILATNPPRSDIFLNLPRVELKPLPEYAIREIMEQETLKRGIQLDNHQMARLQQRAGGNPMLAVRVIEEEYFGLEVEGGDHHRYVDGTPLLLFVGVMFVVFRFIGLGTNNQALYIFGGIAAALFLGLSRVLYCLPKDSRRIQ